MSGTKTKKSAKKIFVIVLIAAIVAYVVIGLCITLADLLGMVKQNKSSRNVALGETRYQEILAEGTAKEFDIYSPEEIAENKNLEVVKLYYFPAKSGEKTDFAIVLPGGGYFECDVNKVAFPCAATLNEAGYSAFVLGYRYGKYSSEYAPIDDLACAVKYIFNHAESFNVKTDNYAVLGYSAGGNLTGLYGSKDLGYAKYDLQKPAALLLAYPWSNINGKVPITGNMWQELVTAVSQMIGNKYLLGDATPSKEKKQSVCVQNHVDGDYPPTYIMQGDNDFITPHKQNALVLAEALKTNGVKYELKMCKGLNHGCGLGEGTTAEGWLAEAIAFWESLM